MLFLSLIALLASANASQFSKSHQLNGYTFEQYLSESGKKYDTQEYQKRQTVFQTNLKKIQTHNANPKATYKMGVNMFTDRTEAELGYTLGGNKHALKNQGFQAVLPQDPAERQKLLSSLPASKDWRNDGVITTVKDQGACGSCWAHAAVETIESFLAINTGVLTEISQQELVACMPNTNNCGGKGGCEGATAELAFDYMAEYGLPEVWQYGYELNTYWYSHTQSNGACLRDLQFGSSLAVPRKVKGDGYVLLPRNSYEDLMVATATVGPVAINIDASTWHAYESGVFSGCAQDNVDINHVVQLVGYGTDQQFGDYWLVRNSWTSQFGENGYIRLARSATDSYCGTDYRNSDGVGCDTDPQNVTVCGMCGILYDSSYPTNTRLW